MDILFKAFAAALLATFVIIGAGQAFLKTNDVRNYPNLRPSQGGGGGSRSNGLATSAAAPQAAAGSGTQRNMSKGEEAAAESGFSTELENPNQ
jgi:hypothetical protein